MLFKCQNVQIVFCQHARAALACAMLSDVLTSSQIAQGLVDESEDEREEQQQSQPRLILAAKVAQRDEEQQGGIAAYYPGGASSTGAKVSYVPQRLHGMCMLRFQVLLRQWLSAIKDGRYKI
jgi:hypothetical protein